MVELEGVVGVLVWSRGKWMSRVIKPFFLSLIFIKIDFIYYK